MTRPRPFRIGDNQFAPDGKSIAFVAGQSWNEGSDFRLFKADLESGTESDLSAKTFFNIRNIEWLPGGESLLLTGAEDVAKKARIWHVSAATGEAEPLTADAASYNQISLDAAARRILATEVRNNFRLYLSAGEKTKMLTAARWASFAPDGKIIYSADDGDIWAMRGDGTEQRQLTNNVYFDFFPRASPDNRFIFFASNRTGATQVWRMDPDGSGQTQLTQIEGGYPLYVSLDGKWLYYQSGLRRTLWRISTEGGGETELSDRKMQSPALSPDGTLVAYFFRDGALKIGIINIADNSLIETFDYADGKSPAMNLAWASDSRTLYFITKQDKNNVLWRRALGKPQADFVADLGGEEISDFAVLPQNDGFAYVRGEWLHDAVIIEGLK